MVQTPLVWPHSALAGCHLRAFLGYHVCFSPLEEARVASALLSPQVCSTVNLAMQVIYRGSQVLRMDSEVNIL
jgi:hypothetical protein